MILISHRGNLDGISLKDENNPDYIINAIGAGFSCEIDFWIFKNKMYLGHDEPQFLIQRSLLDMYQTKLWIHCKNLDALYFIVLNRKKLNGFWHQSDKFTITTNGLIWTYPGQPTTNKSILVHLDKPKELFSGIAGICSDYISLFVR